MMWPIDGLTLNPRFSLVEPGFAALAGGINRRPRPLPSRKNQVAICRSLAQPATPRQIETPDAVCCYLMTMRTRQRGLVVIARRIIPHELLIWCPKSHTREPP